MEKKLSYVNCDSHIKVSIVVPIYDTSLYLERCLQSICSQTYSNLEIILIDDGSQDNSLQICCDYAKYDSRIQVIHQENMGLSETRNKGIRVATGEYITFIDSDDYIDLSMIEVMVQTILDYRADICECGMYVHRVDGNISTYATTYSHPTVIQDMYSLIEAYTHDQIFIPAWNKLYKLSAIRDMFFSPDCVHEEADYTLRLCLAQKKFVVISNLFYHYIKRDSLSLTSRKISSKLFTLQDWGEKMRKQIMLLGHEYDSNADIVLYNSLAHVLKYFKRDYNRGFLLPYELNNEIHSLVNRLLELLIDSFDIKVFQDLENVWNILNDLIMLGVLEISYLPLWDSFLQKMERQNLKYSRTILQERGE